MRRKVKLLVVIFTISLLVSFLPSLAGAESSISLNFGGAKDISELGITKLSGLSPYDKYQTKAIKFSLSPAECSLHPIKEYVYLKAGELKPYTKPGEPQLPMKTFIIKLPQDAEVIGVKIASGKYVEIINDLNLVPMPQPVRWQKGEKPKKIPQLVPDKRVYSLGTYFPGKAISYDVGSDGRQKFVFVRVFPVQYIPEEKKACLITEATINVYYKGGSGGEAPYQGAGVKHVIITPQSLSTEAGNLEAFHDGKGLETEVKTTEWINSQYTEAGDPPHPGYKDGSFPWTGYNYSLAKKIIKYLNDTSAHPDLEYVTFFGDVSLVPPSY